MTSSRSPPRPRAIARGLRLAGVEDSTGFQRISGNILVVTREAVAKLTAEPTSATMRDGVAGMGPALRAAPGSADMLVVSAG